MIDVIIADHQELFRVGMAAVVGAADDVRIVGQPESPEQLLNTLKDSQSSGIDSVDELSVSIFEDPAEAETASDCIAGAHRGERPDRLCALVASTGSRLSFNGWARSR